MQPLGVEKRRVEFTFPQYRVLAKEMRVIGIRESHRPELDYWEAQALYRFVMTLPYRTVAQIRTVDSLLKKLEWAKPEPKTRTLAEVLNGSL